MTTKPKTVPDGYHTVPYLTVRGVEELIEFLKHAFDARELEELRQSEGVIRHAEVRIGDSPIMLSEARDPWKPSEFYLYLADVDAAYERALAAGAKPVMAPTDTFYGNREGGVQDAWGNYWWMATRFEEVTPEEIQRRAAAEWKK